MHIPPTTPSGLRAQSTRPAPTWIIEENNLVLAHFGLLVFTCTNITICPGVRKCVTTES
jgi:hypothetical protein